MAQAGAKLRTPAQAGWEPATFINVDLDIRSRRSLALLADALGAELLPNTRWLVVSARTKSISAEGTVRALVAQLKGLPSSAREAWEAASSRTVDIGIQAGMGGRAFEAVRLTSKTLADIASLGTRLRITVYPPVRR